MDKRRSGILFVVAAASLSSTGGIGIKGVDDPALKVTFYRSLFAALTLLGLLRGSVFVRPTLPLLVAIASYGVCLTAFVVATKWTTAANAIFPQYAGVLWVMLLSPVVLREPLRSRDVLAVSVALAGMALFFVGTSKRAGWQATRWRWCRACSSRRWCWPCARWRGPPLRR